MKMNSTTLNNDSLVRVKTTTGSHQLWFGILKSIPTFQDRIAGTYKSPPWKNKDKDENKEEDSSHKCISLQITSDELWSLFEIYAEKIDISETDLSEWEWSILQFKCGISESAISKFKSQPFSNFSLKGIKNVMVSSAFITMATFSELDKMVNKLSPLNIGNVYGYMYGDSKCAFIESALRCNSEEGNFGKCASYRLHRAGDVVTFSVFRAILPALPKGCIWRKTLYRDLIERIRFRANQLYVTSLTGAQNLSEAESSGIFPEITNNYLSLSDEERTWASETKMYVVLPLMLPWMMNKKEALAVKDIPCNDLIIELEFGNIQDLVEYSCGDENIDNINFVESEVCVDYIILPCEDRLKKGGPHEGGKVQKKPSQKEDSNEEKNSEDHDNDWVRNTFISEGPRAIPIGRTPSPGTQTNCLRLEVLTDQGGGRKIGFSSDAETTPSSSYDMKITTFQDGIHHMRGTDKSTEIPLNFSYIVPGLILHFKSDVGDMLCGKIIYPFTDVVLRYENSSMLCYNAADARDMLWRKCGRKPPKNSHSFLIPLTPEMYNHALSSNAPNLSKINSVTLVLTHNPDWIGVDWDVQISALTTTVIEVLGGAIGFPII